MSKQVNVVLNLKDAFTSPLKQVADKLGKTEKEVKKATNTIKNFQKQATEGFKKVAIGAGAMAVAGGVALYGMAQKTAETADKIDEMSQAIGISRKGYQEWEYILAQNGMEIDSLKKTFKSLTSYVYKANSGNKEAMATFKKLGINVKDSNGQLKSQEQLFEESIKSLQGMKDGTEKARIAYELFGKSGADLRPILNSNADYIKKMKDEAEKFGVVLDDKAIDAGAKFADTLESLKRMVSAVGFSIGADALPSLQQLADTIKANIPAIRELAKGAFASLANTIKFLGDNMNWIKPIAIGVTTAILGFKAIQGVIAIVNTWRAACALATAAQIAWNLAMATNPILLIVQVLAIAIPLVVGLGVALYKNFKPFKDLIDWIVKGFLKLINLIPQVQMIKAGIDVVKTITTKTSPAKKPPGHATGTSYFGGGDTRINEGGRGEVVNLPSGSQIIPHDIAKKSAGKSSGININITVAGNVIGNQQFLNEMGNMFAIKVKTALANI